MPLAPRTRTSMSRTAGALPPEYAFVTYRAAVVLPPTMPATCVPWPYGSPVESPSHDTRSTRAITRVPSAVCGEMPESITATPMPVPFCPGVPSRPSRPLVPCHAAVAPVTWLVTAMSEVTVASAEICANFESRESASSSARDTSRATAPFSSLRTMPRSRPRNGVAAPSTGPCTMTRSRSPVTPAPSKSAERVGGRGAESWPCGRAGSPISRQSTTARNTRGRRMDVSRRKFSYQGRGSGNWTRRVDSWQELLLKQHSWLQLITTSKSIGCGNQPIQTNLVGVPFSEL
jgi:hypothetical protein